MKIRIRPLPYAKDMAFAIRDDDVSYFTPPEKIEDIYRNVWKKGFKVSFATIPMHKGTNNLNVPPKFRNDNKYHPINQNEYLVSYLKTKISEGKIDMLQHGFCHTENTDLPTQEFDLEIGNLSACDGRKIYLNEYSEFYGLNEIEVDNRIKKGMYILEKIFKTKIKVFVSPQELLTKSLWLSLWKNNLNYCGSIGKNIINQVPIEHINLLPLLKVAANKLLKINNESIAENMLHITDIIILSATYRHYWNKFTNHKLSDYWFNHFKNIFETKKKQNTYFIMLTHYWEYFYDWEDMITQKEQYEYLNKILNYVDNNSNVWKCTISELVDWITARENIIFRNKGNKLVLFSHYPIRGLSIQLGENINNVSNDKVVIKYIAGKPVILLDMEANQKITLSI